MRHHQGQDRGSRIPQRSNQTRSKNEGSRGRNAGRYSEDHEDETNYASQRGGRYDRDDQDYGRSIQGDLSHQNRGDTRYGTNYGENYTDDQRISGRDQYQNGYGANTAHGGWHEADEDQLDEAWASRQRQRERSGSVADYGMNNRNNRHNEDEDMNYASNNRNSGGRYSDIDYNDTNRYHQGGNREQMPYGQGNYYGRGSSDYGDNNGGNNNGQGSSDGDLRAARQGVRQGKGRNAGGRYADENKRNTRGNQDDEWSGYADRDLPNRDY